MTITHGTAPAPIVAIIWAVDCYAFLAILRLVLARLPSLRFGRLVDTLRALVDPGVRMVSTSLAKWRGRPVPSPVAWITLIGGLVVVRQLLTWMFCSGL